MEEVSSQRRHTSFFQIWKATWALKGTVFESMCLCLLKHKILNEQKFPILTVFTGFAVKSSNQVSFKTETMPHCNLPLSLCQFIFLFLYLAVCVFYAFCLPLPSLPYPHISIFGGTKLKLSVVFPNLISTGFTVHTPAPKQL